MREQRRRLPKVVSPLEMLDDRIVPSTIHPSIHAHSHHSHMQATHQLLSGSMTSSNPAAASAQPGVSMPASPATVTPSSGSGYNAYIPSSASTPIEVTRPAVTPSPTDIKSGPLAKAGQDLITIYQAFQQGGAGALGSNGPGSVMIQGTSVGIDAHTSGGNFSTYVASLASLGMQIQAQDSATGTVEGFIPISQLTAAAQNAQTLSLSPVLNQLQH